MCINIVFTYRKQYYHNECSTHLSSRIGLQNPFDSNAVKTVQVWFLLTQAFYVNSLLNLRDQKKKLDIKPVLFYK